MPIQLDLRAIRGEARELLKTAQVSPLRFTLLFLAIDLVLNLISTAASDILKDSFGVLSFSFSFVGILVTLLSTVLLAGFTNYCLNIQSGVAMPYDSLFDAFPFAGKVILLEIVQGILIGLGMVLFIIPGVVLAFSYAFALYYICENPNTGVIEALRRSREAMRGYKFQLLLLLLQFWPLALAAAVVLGVCEYVLARVFPETLSGDLLYALTSGVLSAAVEVYLMPYIELAQVGFYRRATASRENEPMDMGRGF